MSKLFWVCMGGALGSGARYLISETAQRYCGSFLYGTFAVNLLGSFFIGLLMNISLSPSWPSSTLRLALTTGVLGGFTTYSAFNFENLRYIQEGSAGWAALYILATVLFCLLAGMLGIASARWLTS